MSNCAQVTHTTDWSAGPMATNVPAAIMPQMLAEHIRSEMESATRLAEEMALRSAVAGVMETPLSSMRTDLPGRQSHLRPPPPDPPGSDQFSKGLVIFFPT